MPQAKRSLDGALGGCVVAERTVQWGDVRQSIGLAGLVPEARLDGQRRLGGRACRRQIAGPIVGVCQAVQGVGQAVVVAGLLSQRAHPLEVRSLLGVA